jgi:hypothetical protein
MSSHADDVGPEVAEWYTNEYAPYSLSPNPENAAKLMAFYVDGYFQHIEGYALYSSPNTEAEWATFLREEIENGWTGSRVVSVETTSLNSSNVTVMARWVRNGTDEVCHWYLATKDEDTWRFTNLVANVDCPMK